MTDRELMQMALKAGFADTQGTVHAFYQLEHFAALVVEAELSRLQEEAAPLREWVGLTEEEELMIGVATGLTGVAIRMIESKLKEKNGK